MSPGSGVWLLLPGYEKDKGHFKESAVFRMAAKDLADVASDISEHFNRGWQHLQEPQNVRHRATAGPLGPGPSPHRLLGLGTAPQAAPRGQESQAHALCAVYPGGRW